MDGVKALTHLDGQGLPLSDHSAQLNHGLHLGDGALDALVNQTFPEEEKTKKQYN